MSCHTRRTGLTDADLSSGPRPSHLNGLLGSVILWIQPGKHGQHMLRTVSSPGYQQAMPVKVQQSPSVRSLEAWVSHVFSLLQRTSTHRAQAIRLEPMNWLSNIRVVLVGSQEPMNVGAAARAMQNFGISDLWLVAPEPRVREDLALHPEGSMAYRLAVHAEEILDNLKVVDTLPEAVAEARLVVGTTVREREIYTGPVVGPKAMAERVAEVAPQGKVALVFGREASGLTTDELDLSQLIVRIPTSPKQPSLNLAQAVLLLCYEVFGAVLNPPEPAQAQLAEQELFDDLREYILRIGFTDEKRLPYAIRRFRRLLHKANLTPGEVQFLRGFLHQSRWYAQHGRRKTTLET